MSELLADRHFGPTRLGYVVLTAAVVVVALLFVWALTRNDATRAEAPATRIEGRVPSPAAAEISGSIDRAQARWRDRLASRGARFEPAAVGLFTDSEPNGCAPGADATSGAFYCAEDGRLHVDLGLIHALQDRFGAAGEVAADYVVLHAIGHRVQDQLGVLDQVAEAPLAAREGSEGLSVRAELQADCYAGIAARGAPELAALRPEDVAGAIRAATAATDARIRPRGNGVVQPEGLAHGTADQRTRWFLRGYETGLFDACDALTAVRL